MEKKESKRKVFNFGDSPLVKQTEQTVVEGYQAIEQREEGGGWTAKSEELRVKSEEGLARRPKGESQFATANPATPQAIPATAMIAQGEPTQNINVPIPVSLHQRLKMISVTKRQNMKDLVALAIKEYVERQGQL